MEAARLWEASELLSDRVRRLRDEYFNYDRRSFHNEILPFSTGTRWDIVYREFEDLAAPERVPFMEANADSLLAMAKKIDLPEDFWRQPLIVRRALFFERVLQEIPLDILKGELIVGAQFNTAMSNCLNEEETRDYWAIDEVLFEKSKELIQYGIGCTGAIPSHIIQDFPKILKIGFKGIEEEAKQLLEETDDEEKRSFLTAVIICCRGVRNFANRYGEKAKSLCEAERKSRRRDELAEISRICDKVPYLPAETFHEAVQSVWFTHMIDMIAEAYPGAGLSYGRLDQMLFPYYEEDLQKPLLTRDQAKEILQCFWIKNNYVYDRTPAYARQGITASYGQLITLGGQGEGGKDLTNDLTYLFLDVIGEMNMIEPKTSIRIHQGTPPQLLTRICKMIQKSQGSPFLLNFDKMSIEALEKEGLPRREAVNYGIVGCIENTAQGCDLSGTVDVNINLAKPLELALNQGKCLVTGKQLGIRMRSPLEFHSFEQFLKTYKKQLRAMIRKMIEIQNGWDGLRSKYVPCPYLSATIEGCMKKGKDVRAGGATYNFITVEGVAISTVADSLAAVKKLVFEDKAITIHELLNALRSNFEGNEILRQTLINKAPKFGNDNAYVDSIGREISRFWAKEVNKYISPSTGRRYTAGYLSWNYFIAFGRATAATPDGRKRSEPLSNAVSPVQGRDINGPTSAVKSVTQYGFDLNPRGASYTITLNPSMLTNDEKLEKLAALLLAYEELGGTSIQFNVIDRETLLDAQRHPQNYQNLLVRVTGYNAYFVTLGRVIQDEIISRTSHSQGF